MLHRQVVMEPLEVLTLSQRVAERLRKSILGGAFRPGDTLVERLVAKQLHVSQTAVREAFIRLEGEGLVQRFPTRETRVTQMTQKQHAEVIRVRLLLEPVAFTDAHKHLAPDKIQVARDLIAEMENAFHTQDHQRYALGDLEFHRFFWRLSRDGTLLKLLETACLPSFGFSMVVDNLDWGRPNPHIALLEAMEGLSEEEVAAAVKRHILATASDWGPAPSKEISRMVTDEGPSTQSAARKRREDTILTKPDRK